MSIELSEVTEIVKEVGHVRTASYCLGEIEDLMTVDSAAGANVG